MQSMISGLKTCKLTIIIYQAISMDVNWNRIETLSIVGKPYLQISLMKNVRK